MDIFKYILKVIATLFVAIGVASAWIIFTNYMNDNITFKVCPNAIIIEGNIVAPKKLKPFKVMDCSVVPINKIINEKDEQWKK